MFRYSLLREKTEKKTRPWLCPCLKRLTQFGSFGLAILSSFLIGLLLGGLLWPESRSESSFRLKYSPKILTYNRTFADSTMAAQAAWEQLIPQHNGFFPRPQNVSERATFSVYHTLHCLNGIRQSYWKVYHHATRGISLNVAELPVMISPPHVRHCIDLIRQSLMCQPDTTIEIKDEIAGGVHGFGVEHRCVDWGELLSLTTELQQAI